MSEEESDLLLQPTTSKQLQNNEESKSKHSLLKIHLLLIFGQCCFGGASVIGQLGLTEFSFII